MAWVIALVFVGLAARADGGPVPVRPAGLGDRRPVPSADLSARGPTPAIPVGCGPSWSRVATPAIDAVGNRLASIAAVGPKDVWAVGATFVGRVYSKTLVEHWDGSAWRVVRSPSPSRQANFLHGVAASGSDDGWAVGLEQDPVSKLDRVLIEHWDGSAWSVAPTPDTSGNAALYAVTVVGPNDVWAVGSSEDADSQPKALLEHWDGSAWTITAAPEVPGSSAEYLFGLAAISPTDIWAVGQYVGSLGFQDLTEHWNGTAWSVAHLPSTSSSGRALFAVAAASAIDVWAVGNDDRLFALHAQAQHWDGAQWTESPGAPGEPTDDRLLSISAVSSRNIWAVGTHTRFSKHGGSSIPQYLIEHWGGTGWTNIPLPAPALGTMIGFYGTATLPSGRAWAAGFRNREALVEQLCPDLVLGSGFSPPTAQVAQGDAAVWWVPTADGASHTVTDHSGMGLFDSGTLPPGSSFIFAFDAAGSYPYWDKTTFHRGSIEVPTLVQPTTGDRGTTFTVTWSATPRAAGFVFDIQIQRPADVSFSRWKYGKTAPSAQFIPDAGSGTYWFRARLRNKLTGKHSGWSPAVAITVS
jgi:hypothetical protein